MNAQSSADFFWHKLNATKEVTSDVKMTPNQFRKMLSQAVAYGYEEGKSDGIRTAQDMSKHDNPYNPFNNFF